MRYLFAVLYLALGMAGGQKPQSSVPIVRGEDGHYHITSERDFIVDVPAIQKHSRYDQPPPWVKWWTCADKTRILEHDEQTPPQYWCRKVQP